MLNEKWKDSLKISQVVWVKFLLWGYIASPHGGPVLLCSWPAPLQDCLWTGGWELILQYFFEGVISINGILRYMQQLHCDLKVSVISIGTNVTGTKIFLPTFIPEGLYKFQLNITENKNLNIFTHQDNSLLNSIQQSLSIQGTSVVKKSWYKQIK